MKKKYTIDELVVGMSVMRDFPITDKMVEDFARISGDYNPVHLDDAYAKTTVFKKRIVHGMLVGSFVSNLIGTGMPGEGAIYMKQDFSFIKPVFHGDMITVKVTVVEVNKEKDYVIMSTECFNQDRVMVISGEAKVRPGK